MASAKKFRPQYIRFEEILEEFSILIQIKSVQKVTHRKQEQTVGDVASGREVTI